GRGTSSLSLVLTSPAIRLSSCGAVGKAYACHSTITATMSIAPTVSFEDEALILVNDADEEVGFATKQSCHDGEGLLHRAFSVFLFSPTGDVLLQQRSVQKRLWPGVWSNTCCSHPRRGETLDDAVRRRLREELTLEAPVQFLFKFQYHARYDGWGAER